MNSNVYIESHTKTTCKTSEMMLNVLKAQIVVKAFMHRFTCCCSFFFFFLQRPFLSEFNSYKSL